jgi:hypothetical protein
MLRCCCRCTRYFCCYDKSVSVSLLQPGHLITRHWCVAVHVHNVMMAAQLSQLSCVLQCRIVCSWFYMSMCLHVLYLDDIVQGGHNHLQPAYAALSYTMMAVRSANSAVLSASSLCVLAGQRCRPHSCAHHFKPLNGACCPAGCLQMQGKRNHLQSGFDVLQCRLHICNCYNRLI